MLRVGRDPRRERIGCLNWPDAFPYAPEAEFEISHSGAELHLGFRVREDAVRAVCASDGGRAWCTCIGRLLLCRGAGRHGREPLPEPLLQGIRRTSTLGADPFGLREGTCSWEVRLDIPAAVFGLETFDGLHARGNFYKCGDGLPVPHYLSWAPVGTPRPDFHRPDFFEEIVFV